MEAVDNQIEVLPSSVSDDRIRMATYRALYSKAGLEHYQLGEVSPIHIVVKNGVVTLIGSVKTEADKSLAGAAAKDVLNVSKVNNNLVVEK